MSYYKHHKACHCSGCIRYVDDTVHYSHEFTNRDPTYPLPLTYSSSPICHDFHKSLVTTINADEYVSDYMDSNMDVVLRRQRKPFVFYEKHRDPLINKVSFSPYAPRYALVAYSDNDNDTDTDEGKAGDDFRKVDVDKDEDDKYKDDYIDIGVAIKPMQSTYKERARKRRAKKIRDVAKKNKVGLVPMSMLEPKPKPMKLPSNCFSRPKIVRNCYAGKCKIDIVDDVTCYDY